jgi:hypothetical protein
MIRTCEWQKPYAKVADTRRRLAVRIHYVIALLTGLGATPALAQVIVTTPGNDAAAAHHQYRAEQHRAAGREAMHAARANAAMGNYAAAAQDQAVARHNWHEAHHQEHKAMRDSSPVAVQLGQ